MSWFRGTAIFLTNCTWIGELIRKKERQDPRPEGVARSQIAASGHLPNYALSSLASPVTDYDKLNRFPGGSPGDSSARTLEKLVVENARSCHPALLRGSPANHPLFRRPTKSRFPSTRQTCKTHTCSRTNEAIPKQQQSAHSFALFLNLIRFHRGL